MVGFGAAIGAVLAVSQAQAATPVASAPDPPNTVEAVVITGRRITEAARRRAVSEFVRGLSAETQRGRLARWDTGLCPGVVGLPEKHATYIADRIAMEAHRLKLEVGRPGCRPEVLILFTSDPDRASREFQRKHRSFFASRYDRERLETGGGKQSLEAFKESRLPVRWWHVAKLATSDGRPVSWVVINGVRVPASVNGVPSRLASAWKEDLSRALIIVDSRQMKGVSYEQLASYLAMVTLAQLEPNGRPGSLATITSLFSDRDAGRTPPESMTEQDRAYLKGLYEAPADVRNINAHRGSIRRSLMKAGGG